jgi:hypothetical protein
VLVDIDEAWPRLPYRLAITGLFLARLTHEQKRGRSGAMSRSTHSLIAIPAALNRVRPEV